jgi:zinc metalloprotease ZmpB
MSQEFNESAKVHMTRDQDGHVRDLLHTEEPFLSTARTPQLAAKQYLEKFGGMLGVPGEHMGNLGLPPDERPGEAGVEYRLLEEKTQFDATTVVYGQTCFGVEVWEAGVAVHVLDRPLRVMSAQSTLHHDLHVDLPRKAAIDRLERLTEETLARSLGLAEKEKDEDKDKHFHRSSLKIERREWYIYRYDAAQRVHVSEPITGEHQHFKHSHRYPDLPPVNDEIKNGRHYLVSAVYFVLSTAEIANLHWVALVEAETLSVLLLRAFVDSVNGLVFTQDPVTLNGGPLPSATDAQLNPLRSSVLLPGLVPPVGGNYALTGDIIQVQDFEPPPAAPPTEPIGTDFNFNVRTDNFSAVNAYYHCDRFFRLVRDLGFDLPTYFGGTLFPTRVDHRGRFGTVNGIEINAYCAGTGSFGIQRTAFMLADLTNVAQPLGLADDWRVVLHELGGHGILYNHVNSANFLFSHSAGDSFGAVLNDYDSQAADRFQTFPWVYSVINRRHDRTPAAGWGWNGAIALPPSPSYSNEQILCTTHFRIYRSIGGDSTEVPMRIFAGNYVAYLMLRTIGALTQATTPANATAYCSGLMNADLGNWTSAQRTGGCYWKVIRWAFEKQGAFQPVAMPKPNNNIGDPPDVDVYIDDGRHGEYQYEPSGAYPYLQRFWETTDIWNRHHPDAQTTHQTPIVGLPNYAYVVVKNRGTQAANNITVRGWHCRPSAGLVWPDDWKPMTTNSLLVPTLASGAQVVVGPFEWHPTHHGHECMFMDTGAAGDLANNDPATLLPSATGPTPLWRMVPCDNNQGLRAVIPVPGGGHREDLVEAFHKRRFWASNPTPNTVKIEVRTVLPPFLASRGWVAYLDNPGGGSFSLGPRDTREMHPRLISGQDFTELQVLAAGRVAIEFIVLADGLVVGGLTYVLDPHLKEPAREEPEEKEHRERDEDEKECHEPEKREHRKCCQHEACEPHRCCKREKCDVCDERERPRRIKFEIDLD